MLRVAFMEPFAKPATAAREAAEVLVVAIVMGVMARNDTMPLTALFCIVQIVNSARLGKHYFALPDRLSST